MKLHSGWNDVKTSVTSYSCLLQKNIGRGDGPNKATFWPLCIAAVLLPISISRYCIHEIPTNVRPRVCLFWFLYAYDGQYVCRPGCVDIFFEFIDRAAAKAIVLRGTGRDVKFTVRLIVDELVIDAFSENHKMSWFMNKILEFMLDLALQQQSQSV